MLGNLLKSEFTKNVFTLMTGTTFAQILTIISAPFLMRFFSPEDLGVYALFSSITLLISVVACGRYELSIVLPEKDEDALNILILSVFLTCVVTILSSIILFIFMNRLEYLLNIKFLSNIILFIPFSVFLTSIYQIFTYWANRKKKYKKLASNRVQQSLITTFMSLLLGFLSFNYVGLIMGYLLGLFATSINLGVEVFKDNKSNKNNISFNEIMRQAKIYQDFPKANLWHAFMDIFQANGVNFIIAAFWGNTILGIYSLTYKVLKFPASVICSSVSQVFFQKASDLHNKHQDLLVFTRNTIRKLGLIGLPVFGFIFIAAPYLFTFMFGAKWQQAGVYAQILTPAIFLNFLISPVSQIPIILGKQKINFYLGAIVNLIQLGIFCLAIIYKCKIETALLGISCFTCVNMILAYIWYNHLIMRSEDYGYKTDLGRVLVNSNQ